MFFFTEGRDRPQRGRVVRGDLARAALVPRLLGLRLPLRVALRPLRALGGRGSRARARRGVSAVPRPPDLGLGPAHARVAAPRAEARVRHLPRHAGLAQGAEEAQEEGARRQM